MLCDGAAGVAHLFNRLFQATGDAWLAQAARRWFAQVFEMQRHGSGIAGYQSCLDASAPGAGGWQTDPGLLTGTAGLALALLPRRRRRLNPSGIAPSAPARTPP